MTSHHRRYRITTRQDPIAKHLLGRGRRVAILVTADTDRRGIKISDGLAEWFNRFEPT